MSDDRSTWGFRSFTAALVRFGRARLALATALALAGSLTEGIGLLLLVPVLHLAGVTGSGSEGIFAPARHVLSVVGARPTLGSMLVLFVLVVAARSLLVRERDVLLARISLEFVDDVRIRLQRDVVGADWATITSLPHADVLHALTSDVARVGLGTRSLLDMVRGTSLVVAYVVASLILSPSATGIALLVSLALVAVTAPLIRRARALGVALSTTGRRLYGAATDILDGIKLAKAHAAERAHLDLFSSATVSQRAANIGYAKASATTALVQNVGIAVASAVLVWFSVEHLHLASGRLLVMIFLLSRLLPLVTGVLQSVQQLANALPGWTAVHELSARCASAAEVVAIDHPPIVLRDAIHLRGVDVRHAGALLPALHDVDLDIPARSMTAIVGASGAGKTTLADVLIGLLQPLAGSVSIDEVVLDATTSRAWRERVAYVPQEAFLFPTTIAANLRWARGEATDEEVWDALRRAGAEGFVRALPDGLDTTVGERGGRLSGGERQRIAIAQALLRMPELLVLDEPTSSLDTANELVVRDAISRLAGTVTIVVVAHRLSTVEHAERVVVLDAGRVVEVGSWDELAWRPVAVT